MKRVAFFALFITFFCAASLMHAQTYGPLRHYTDVTDAARCAAVPVPTMCKQAIMVVAMSDDASVLGFEIIVVYEINGVQKRERKVIEANVYQGVYGPYVLGHLFLYPDNFTWKSTKVKALIGGAESTQTAQ